MLPTIGLNPKGKMTFVEFQYTISRCIYELH